MSGEVVRQGLLMLAQGLLIILVLLSLFRLRGAFGLVPIYVTVAILYQLANLTAGTVLISIGSDLAISPGSVVIFPAVLVVVLLIYIREDAGEARKLIYGLLAADLVVATLGVMLAQHFWSPLMINPLGLPPELFLGQPRILIVGTLSLYVDAVLIIVIYELLSRPFAGALFPRLALTLVSVLMVDTALFVTGSFAETPAFTSILASHAIGKTIAGLFYALCLAAYLSQVDSEDRLTGMRWLSLGDLFEHLTYRQRFEALQAEITRDRLTGVFNRAFFDDMCTLLAAGSARSGRSVSLLIIDVDHFKQINDTFGHRVGDRVLHSVAASIRSACRASDLVCRYGGEEFGVLLPDTQMAEGISIATRIGPTVTQALAQEDRRWVTRPVTVTVGLATFPIETDSFDELIQLADRRMYQGKGAGRNRVVPASLAELNLLTPLRGTQVSS